MNPTLSITSFCLLLITHIVRVIQAEVKSGVWEWVRISKPDRDRLNQMQQSLQDQAASVVAKYRSLLVRKRQGGSSGTEVIAR